ncbi:MAG: F0F1 ATP synthase subunit alpha, partial [Clostridia bacterium]|nr:F0F1 ATP synthase subunit alpha [Clostridia bacterium]
NVISITDGQIFLESDLFMSGQRPAVNIGLSVSRVGGDAQTKAMKSATGTLRLDLAQYRELKVFMQFASELDDATKQQLDYGKGLMELLRQKQYHPYSLHEQIILLVTAMNKIVAKVDFDKITKFASELLEYYRINHANLCARIDATKKLSEQDKAEIVKISSKFLAEVFEK